MDDNKLLVALAAIAGIIILVSGFFIWNAEIREDNQCANTTVEALKAGVDASQLPTCDWDYYRNRR